MGEIFELEVGEVVITQRKPANTLNISENNARKHISILISKELITTKITQSVRRGYAENFKNTGTATTISNTGYYTGTTIPTGATSESDDEQNIYAFYRKEEIKEFNNKKRALKKSFLKRWIWWRYSSLYLLIQSIAIRFTSMGGSARFLNS
ncbi:MAG: hypothetical protein ACRC6R_06925 [Bacteroidales bacterium]